MALVAKVRDAAAILLPYLHCRLPVICSAKHRIFLPDMLQRKAPVILINTRRHGPLTHLQEIVEILLVPDLLPEIQLPQMAVSQDRHNVADPVIIQMKRSGIFMIYDIHRYPPSSILCTFNFHVQCLLQCFLRQGRH